MNKQITGDITELPWDAAYGYNSGTYGIYKKDEIETKIQTVPICRISPTEKVNKRDKANAAYIVKACNLFPEAIELLEKIVSLDKYGAVIIGCPEPSELFHLAKKAKELINKAKS